MKRRALLIECSAVPGESFLPGAVADVSNFQSYLTSLSGGAWYEDEIKILRNPTVDSVRQCISQLKNCDYGFTTFSGHGRHLSGHNIDETMVVCLGGELKARELTIGTKWSLVSVDVCRKVERVKSASAKAMTESIQRMAVNADLFRRSRAYFENSMSNCEDGNIFLYSCSLNEAAGENEDGGFFSRALVDCGRQLGRAKGRRDEIVEIDEIFRCAIQRVSLHSNKQNPVIHAGRRLNYFPFAIGVS